MKKYFFLLLILTACAKDNGSPDWKLVWSDEDRGELAEKSG